MSAVSPSNPQRPTPTATLWAIGIVGGIAVSVFVFLTGAGDPVHAQQTVAGMRQIGMGALFLALAVAGGWSALRRNWRPGPVVPALASAGFVNVRLIGALVALAGLALLVFGLSGHVSGRYRQAERIEMTFGAVLLAGGGLVYRKGWPLA